MDRRPTAAAPRSYVDFQPLSRWVREEGADTILVELPGFTREQLRVQLQRSCNVKITGERPLGDKKWSRFQMEFQTPKNCNTKEIHAKFEHGTLKVIMPKMITGARQEAESKPKPTMEAPSMTSSQKAQDEKKSTEADKQDGSQHKPTPEAPAAKKAESMMGSQKGQDEDLPKVASTTKGDKQVNDETREPTLAKSVAEKTTKKERSSSNEFAEGGKNESEKEKANENSVGGHKILEDENKDNVSGDGRVTFGNNKTQYRKFIINMVVACLVVLGLGIYVGYTIRSSRERN